jgi:hypothetical protein
MQLWIRIIKDIKKMKKNVKIAIKSANNHYAAFGPLIQ